MKKLLFILPIGAGLALMFMVVFGESSISSNSQLASITTAVEQGQPLDLPTDADATPGGCMLTPARFASASVVSNTLGMIWIAGGEFTMGTNEEKSYASERPSHRVQVDGFWIDVTEVTNKQFREFVEATGYITMAERPPDWEQIKKQVPPGTPKPPDSMLVASSLVFFSPDHQVSLGNPGNWWAWTPGADWQHPEGLGSSIQDLDDHPVVQVSWEDVNAYTEWAGKRLPTEAEWEFAARGGLESKRYAWGEKFKLDDQWMANIWQGHFPLNNSGEDGYLRTSPVRSFPSNGHGLHDMIGNVWEWCSDWYSSKLYNERIGPKLISNPYGPRKSFDPAEPYAARRVIKGGSFLCTKDYCNNYRPSARRGTDWDTGMSHLGFRCVMSGKMQETL